MLYCTRNELQILSALNPTCNYSRIAGKTDAPYPVSIVLGGFVLAIVISSQKSNVYLLNIGNHRELEKLRKNTCENVEKQTLSCRPRRPIVLALFTPE